MQNLTKLWLAVVFIAGVSLTLLLTRPSDPAGWAPGLTNVQQVPAQCSQVTTDTTVYTGSAWLYGLSVDNTGAANTIAVRDGVTNTATLKFQKAAAATTGAWTVLFNNPLSMTTGIYFDPTLVVADGWVCWNVR